MLTDEQIKAMRERCAARCFNCAGSGAVTGSRPEHAPDCDGRCHNCPVEVLVPEMCGWCHGSGHEWGEHVVANYYTDLPAALDEIDRLRAERAELQRLIRDLVELIKSACPDASWWQDELADRVDKLLEE